MSRSHNVPREAFGSLWNDSLCSPHYHWQYPFWWSKPEGLRDSELIFKLFLIALLPGFSLVCSQTYCIMCLLLKPMSINLYSTSCFLPAYIYTTWQKMAKSISKLQLISSKRPYCSIFGRPQRYCDLWIISLWWKIRLPPGIWTSANIC